MIWVPSPEKITADYLLENAEWVGKHAVEGELYLLATYLCAVREDGEVRCLARNILEVESLNYPVGVIGGMPYMNQIRAMNTKGKHVAYCEGVGWVTA